jgi:argininosuccinate lyase
MTEHFRYDLILMKKTSPLSRSGRFAGGPAADVAQFTQSVSFDWRLWRHDIVGSMVHATALRKAGLITAADLDGILRGLEEIAERILKGKFVWKTELEDVHMNIEAELTRRVPAGAKLHTGRSRNDQVALDLRLWVRSEVIEVLHELAGLQRALLGLAEREREVVIPGYTHLQRAQPVYFAHHLLAYIEMLSRDAHRFQQALVRTNVCPLGAGALAGSTLPLDRVLVARLLHFTDLDDRVQVAQNSMDAVSDRDFAIEFCSCAALTAVHLSRLAEDFVLWASAEFGFITIADAYTTGSSLMPQKKNPDIAELARGKSGRVIGNLVALLTLLKGLPLSYNRDLQEDKEALFDTADTLRATLRILAAMLQNTRANPERCLAAASDPALLATDLADYLVVKGLPFRQAHHAVGGLVALAERMGKRLDQLSPAELKSVHEAFEADALQIFDLRHAMDRRTILGSPGTREVGRQLDRWRALLKGKGTARAASKLGSSAVAGASARQRRRKSRRLLRR